MNLKGRRLLPQVFYYDSISVVLFRRYDEEQNTIGRAQNSHGPDDR